MPQNIRDVMTSNPCTIDADRSVAYAAKMMQEEDVGLAPIVEDGKLIGMLTDRDIATRVAAEGRDPDQVKVRDVASTQRLHDRSTAGSGRSAANDGQASSPPSTSG